MTAGTASKRRSAATDITLNLAGAVSAALPLSALLALVWLAARPDADVWAHLLANVLPRQAMTTVQLMLGVGLVCAFIGTLSAWFVTFYAVPMRRLLGWALLAPLALPTYLMAYGYGDFLDQAGPVYRAWQSLAPNLTYPDFRSLPGAVMLMSLVLYPYVYLSARTAFVQQSALLIEAGRSLGQSPWRCFFAIGLPMARPAIIVGVALALMECLNDIGAVEFLGVETLTLGVYDTWLVRGNLAGAAQLALTLLAFMGLLLFLERSQRGKGAHYNRQGRHRSLPDFQTNRATLWLMSGFCLLPIALGFIVPVALLLAQADAAQWQSGLTQAALNSLGLAMAAALSVAAFGLVLGFAVRHARRGRAKWRRLFSELAALGYAVPGTILALGVMTVLAFIADLSGGLIVLSGTAAGLLVAYMARFLSLSFGTMQAGYGRISPGLDMAARSLGRYAPGLLRDVHLPLLRGPLLTAMILVFVDVMKELPMTLLLRPFDFDTLATHVYTHASLGQMEDAALPALMILAVGLLPVVLSLGLIDRLRRR